MEKLPNFAQQLPYLYLQPAGLRKGYLCKSSINKIFRSTTDGNFIQLYKECNQGRKRCTIYATTQGLGVHLWDAFLWEMEWWSVISSRWSVVGRDASPEARRNSDPEISRDGLSIWWSVIGKYSSEIMWEWPDWVDHQSESSFEKSLLGIVNQQPV